MAEKQTTEKQSTFKELVLPVIVLVVICLVCSALLAVLNDITAPIIAENTQAETLAAYVSVLPEGTTTDSMTAIDGLTTASVEGAVKTANGDVAVKAAASGYSGKDVTVYVAFDAEGAISVSPSTAHRHDRHRLQGLRRFLRLRLYRLERGRGRLRQPCRQHCRCNYFSNGAFNAINAAIDCYNNEIKGVQ